MSEESRQHTEESRQHTVDSMKGKGKNILSTIYYLLSTKKRSSLSTAYCLLPAKKSTVCRLLSTKAGFTLVELMITMVVFVFVIAAASGVLTGLLTQFKQQSKIAETNIEGIIGLEILRQDIDRAGYGLPWNLNGASYREAEVEPNTPWIDRDFNDGPPNNPARGTDPGDPSSNPPGGIRSGNGYALNGSDVLVIKAIDVARNGACSKSNILSSSSPYLKTWDPSSENLASTDRVIVLSMGETSTQRILIVGTYFYTTRGNVTSSPWLPTDSSQTRIVYGVDPDTDLRMPFNRADFYVRRPSAASVPTKCAPNTGILYKGIVKQANGRLEELPLFDCVADMQVVYRRDTDGDGTIDNVTNDLSALTAKQIREQVKEVRVYILAQEGQRDPNYTYPNSIISIPAYPDPGYGLGSTFDFAYHGITDWQNYRWKLYTIIATPNNLR